jgi:hypothetical protein
MHFKPTAGCQIPTVIFENKLWSAMSCTSMNEVKIAMKSAHDRSFFLYSNDIVSPLKAMFVHEIDCYLLNMWLS